MQPPPFVFTDLDQKPIEKFPPVVVPQFTVPSTKVPPGYLPIELSTNGRLGVPALIHCRNFQTGDIYDLSLFNDEILPDRVISILNTLILEPGIDVALWPDKVIIELMVRIYINFFTPTLQQVNFPWDESDLQWLEDHNREAEAKALVEKTWKPKIDLNLTSFKIDNLDSSVKPYVRIKKKNREGVEELNVKFLAYPRYGDSSIIRTVTREQFGETDKVYTKIQFKYEKINQMEVLGQDTSEMGVDQQEFLKWQLYEVQKASWLAKVTVALYLTELNGRDVSQLPLQEKVDLVGTPLFDINLSKKLDAQYNKMQFGINPEVLLKNPITGAVCKRNFTFRVMDVIQALSEGNADGYDVSYDD